MIYNFKEVSEQYNVTQPLPKYARVSLLLKKCKENPLRYTIIEKESVLLNLIKLEQGDLPVWKVGQTEDENFNGHIGFTTFQIDLKTIKTIEGNTTFSSSGNQREGGGVYERKRNIHPSTFRTSFNLNWFIRVKNIEKE